MKKLLFLFTCTLFLLGSCSSDDDKEDVRTVVSIASKKKNYKGDEESVKSIFYIFDASNNEFDLNQPLDAYTSGKAVNKSGDKVNAKYKELSGYHWSELNMVEGKYFVLITVLSNDSYSRTSFFIDAIKGQGKLYTRIFESGDSFYQKTTDQNLIVETIKN